MDVRLFFRKEVVYEEETGKIYKGVNQNYW
jgi:hypothetical protein